MSSKKAHKITLSNAQLYAARESAAQLAQHSLPVRTALRIARLATAIEAALGPVEQVRGGIIQEHTERDADGNPVPVISPQTGQVMEGQVKLTPEGTAQVMELMADASEVDADPLPISELGEHMHLPASTLIGLGPLVSDE